MPLIRKRWRLFLLTTCAASVAQLIGIPQALLTRKMVKLVAHETHKHVAISDIEHTLWVLGGLLVGLAILRGVCRWFRGVLGERFAQRTIVDLRKEMLAHIHTLSMGYFDKRAAGKIVIRFVGDAQGLRGWLAIRLVSIPSDILTIIGVLIAIWSIDFQLFVAVVIPPLALLPVLLIVNPRARLWTRAARGEQSRLTGDLTDRVEMMAAIKATNAQAQSLEPLNKRIEIVADSVIHRSYLDAWGQGVALTVGSLSLCAIGIWGSILILHGESTSGDIVGAVWLAVLLRSPINRLTSTNIAYHRVKVAFDRIDALLTRKPEPGFDAGLAPYTGDGMRIRFKELGYHDRHGRWLFKGVDKTLTGAGCVVVRGERHASNVLFELILRIRRPHEGRIALDGVNARKLRVVDIRSHIGWVDAERNMVPATLLARGISPVVKRLESIELFADQRPTMDEIELVHDLEHHARISGAKGLALALACALINDPPIVLIDEPEIGLDAHEIEELSRWIEQESSHRLVVVGSHRGWARAIATRLIRLRSPADE